MLEPAHGRAAAPLRPVTWTLRCGRGASEAGEGKGQPDVSSFHEGRRPYDSHVPHRELGFFGTREGCLSGWLPFLAGIGIASAAWSEGAVWGLGGFVAGMVIAHVMLASRKHKRRLSHMATWEVMLDRDVGLGGIEVTDLEDTDRGLRLRLTLPARLTFPRVAHATKQVEIAAGLPRGGADVERDRSAAHVVWLYATLSKGDEHGRQPLLPDPGAGIASVNEPVPIGTYADGERCTVGLGHANGLIAGGARDDVSIERFYRIATAQLVRCNNALVWYAVPGGARQVAPWLDARRPALDWIATDLDETERLLNAAVAVARRRSVSGPAGDRVRPTEDVPALVVMLPDAGLVMGSRSAQHRRISNTVVELAQTGQPEAVTVMVGTRLDTSAGPALTELRSYCGLIVGLGVSHDSQAWRLFPDMIRPDREALSGEGSMHVWQAGGDRALPAWLYEASRQDAIQVARECADRRPVLEDAAAAAKTAYGSRWRRWRTAGAGTDAEFHRIVDPDG